MRVLGIDYGDSHIGLAVSDKLLLTAQPLGSYRSKSKEEDKKYFKELVSKYEIGEIVLGFPLRMDGSPGTRVEKTKEFAGWLKKILKIPIIFWDERLTTKQAVRILSQQKIKAKRKKILEDQTAASVILSSYLESKQGKNHAT
ncbi:MAG: Holliday junction resolvase RuvX [Candidatus Aminicenantes bacterium]|nr:Holliday junction resolvase RuvX [Candidatus Aminicenantes bacterium]